MYDIVGGPANPAGRGRAAIYDRNMANSRHLEADEVDLRMGKILKGRPHGATSKYGETHIQR